MADAATAPHGTILMDKPTEASTALHDPIKAGGAHQGTGGGTGGSANVLSVVFYMFFRSRSFRAQL